LVWETLTQIISLIKERATFVSDFWELSRFFFSAPETYEPKSVKKAWKDGSANIMHVLATILDDIPDFTSETIEKTVKAWIQEKELGFGKVLMPFRLSLVGNMSGPHVFDIAALLGKEETLSRLKRISQELG